MNLVKDVSISISAAFVRETLTEFPNDLAAQSFVTKHDKAAKENRTLPAQKERLI
jgi:hypothetical protein